MKQVYWKNRAFIDKKHQYLNNEILVPYLNLDVGSLAEWHDDLRYLLPRLMIHTDLGKDFARRGFNDLVGDTRKIMNRVDAIYLSLPPYDTCLDRSRDYDGRLVRGLNKHAYLFEDGAESDPHGTGWIYADSNEFGYLTYDDNGEERFWLTRFDLTSMMNMWEDKFDVDSLLEVIESANATIKNVIGRYIHWLEGVLRVKFVYEKLIDEFYHIRHGFLDGHESAEQFEKYLRTEKLGGKEYMRLGVAQPHKVNHEVFRPDDGRPILCDSFDFDRIGDFLCADFFLGLKNNYVPKKCANCGKWFLLAFGKYSDYCENPLADDPSKTCRDVSSRKKYDDKCRTDPVWLAYSRAYKAHYARYMKKKMTIAEFEKWGRFAIELREKAIAGEIEFGEYERLIKV